MTTTTHDPRETDIERAEMDALALQDDEERAAEKFEAVRLRLAAGNQADEVTQTAEFRDWMAARARTDEAWGRWAMAKDAAQD